MSTFVFLVEERSMKGYLAALLPRLLPPSWSTTIVPHEGKTDLLQSVPRKLSSWNAPDVRFAVLIDQDSNDCQKLKGEIVSLCERARRPDVLVRIVCRTLESWIMGDLQALGTAFEQSLSKHQNKALYRSPDSCGDPIGAVRLLCASYPKASGARLVGQYARLEAGGNASASFHAFVAGVRRLAGLQGAAR